MQIEPVILRDLHKVVARKAEVTRRYGESPSWRARAIVSKAGKACWDMLPNSVLSTSLFLKLGKLIHRAHVKWAGRKPGSQKSMRLLLEMSGSKRFTSEIL
jgi:hypothetical protein